MAPRKSTIENPNHKTSSHQINIKVIAKSIEKVLSYTRNMEFRKNCLTLINAENSKDAGKNIEKLLKKIKR